MNGRQSVEQEVLATWAKVVSEFGLRDANRADVSTLLARVEVESLADCREHLTLWLGIYDEALHFLLSMNQAMQDCFVTSNRGVTRAFVLLLARILSLATAVRRLITSGLEDAARPVARSLLETLDLAIVTFFDEAFAADFGAEETYSANAFWKAQIGFGKLNPRIRRAFETAGLTTDQIDGFFGRRFEMKGILSDSVHSSYASAFRSYLVPSLRRSDQFRLSPLGHVSIHSPGLLSLIISEVHWFGAVITNSYALNPPPPLFRDERAIPSLGSMFAAGLTLDALVKKYDAELPPPLAGDEGEDEIDA
jgi:hypothetical protein